MGTTRRMSLGYGLLCLALGGLWLLDEMGHLPYMIHDYVFSWRFLLVVIGAFILIKNSRSVFGMLVLAAGIISSATRIWQLPQGWEDFLPPLALIIVGAVLLLRPNPHRPKADASDENVLNRATVFGSFKHQMTTVLFKGGFLTAVFGSNLIDFTKSHLGKEHVTIQCSSVFGSSILIVPQGWDIKLNTSNILGSTEDKRYITDPSIAKEGVLEVTGFTLFGSLEIRS